MRLGLIGIVGAIFCLMTACSDEPDFDTRYEKEAQEISERARELDAEDARVRVEMGLPVATESVAAVEKTTDQKTQ
jgi:ABC-type enterochelin transport system substrate-binding protein